MTTEEQIKKNTEDEDVSQKIDNIISVLKGENYSMAEYILDRTMKRLRSRSFIT